MFFHFGQKFENSKWPPYVGGGNFLKTAKSTFLIYPWVKNFDEITLSRTVKQIEAILCFAILGKNSKIQNGRHFWRGENFLKIAIGQIPCCLIISTKSLYLTRLRRQKQIRVLLFLAKIRKFKMVAIFEGEFFENC